MAAALLLDLRTPLARLSLAAQRLGREAVRPADHALAAGMQDAVEELDVRIDSILPLLVDVEARPSTDRRLAASIFEQLAERLRPALDARGIELTIAPPPDTLELEVHAARRLAATLVQSGAAWAGPGGSLALGALSDDAAPAIELCCERATPDASDPPTEPAPELAVTPELRARAERFVVTPEAPNRVRVAAWLGASS
jgi:hypothetical protein